MSTTPAPAIYMKKLNAFIGQFVTDLGAAAHTGMVVLGEKLGLYKTPAGGAVFGEKKEASIAGSATIRVCYSPVQLGTNSARGVEDGVSPVKHYRFVLSCLFVFLVGMSPSDAQTQSGDSPSPTTSASSNLSNQEFHCHTGYGLSDCEKDIAQLKTVLARYPAGELGHWTWILVRSEDWKPIVRRLRLKESPAFSALEQRETFLEEALFGHEVLRSAELVEEWQLPLNQLLSLAVTHELGHALCDEHDEAVADRFGEELRKGHTPPCRIPRAKGTKSLLASLAGAETFTVPLNIEGARIFVTVRVNDKTARLLLDTGAGMTLVLPKFAQGTIELQRLNIEQQAGIGQASIRHLSITLGELTFKDHVVGVLDMTDVNSRTGASIDGLLGEDILCRFRSVRINFKGKTLELER